MPRLIVTVLPVLAWILPLTVSAELIDGEELLDPTRPIFLGLGQPAGPVEDRSELGRGVVAASFDVSFVRAGSANPMAIVNEQRVTIGDSVGGATVVGIDRNGVTLLVNSEERRVTLFGSNVRAPAVSR